MTTHVVDPRTTEAVDGRPRALASEPPAHVAASRASSREGAPTASSPVAWAALAVLAALGILVFWIFEALPFQDLPAHAGLIAMRHRFATSAFEQRFYVLAPHVGPYSLFRFLGEGFVGFLGPIGAVRALGTLPIVATPLAMLFARRRLYGDRSATFGFFGLALSFGFMTLLGFASYLLGFAVMVVGLTLWLELLVAADAWSERVSAGGPRTLDGVAGRAVAVAAFVPLLFVAHGHAFLLFLFCAGVACLAVGRRLARIACTVTLLPAVGLAAYVAWLERGGAVPPGSAPVDARLAPVFQSISEKLGLLVTPTLLTRSGLDFVLAIALWVLALACAAATARLVMVEARAGGKGGMSREARHTAALYVAAAALLALFALLPHAVGWFGFVDGRLVPMVLSLLLLGIRPDALQPRLANVLDVGAKVAAVMITGVAFYASYSFQAEARGYREVLARVPAQSTLLNLPLDPNSDVFTAHPFVHYDKLVLADRPVVVSDVWFHQGTALYPTPENPALRLPRTYRESDLRSIDWPAYRLEDWDFVLIRTRPSAPAPTVPPVLALEEHHGGWWLFRRR